MALPLEKMTLEDAERRLIAAAMESTNNNMTRAASQLGVTRRTLGYRLRKHGLYEALKKAGETDVVAGAAPESDELANASGD